METCNLAPFSPHVWGLRHQLGRRWWLGTNWLLIGPHWQISHLHQHWHWLGANNVFVRAGRRMSGPCQRGALVRTRDNNGLVAANYVSKAIKVFLMLASDDYGGINSTRQALTHWQSRGTKKKGRIPHIFCPSSNAVSRLYKYFEKFLCKCWHFKVCNNFDGMQTAVGKTKIWWLPTKETLKMTNIPNIWIWTRCFKNIVQMNVVRWRGIPEITNIQIGKLHPRVEFQIFCQLIKYTGTITTALHPPILRILILSDILTF